LIKCILLFHFLIKINNFFILIRHLNSLVMWLFSNMNIQIAGWNKYDDPTTI